MIEKEMTKISDYKLLLGKVFPHLILVSQWLVKITTYSKTFYRKVQICREAGIDENDDGFAKEVHKIHKCGIEMSLKIGESLWNTFVN